MAAELLPDGTERQALLHQDWEHLSQSEDPVARSLAAWFQGYWVRAYSELDIASRTGMDAPRALELKRQISSHAAIFARKVPRPSVSLCMIVRNNEATLARALESVKPLVDEFVIVDTGSTDRTVEIASLYTDQIHQFEWIDDFAAARNFALKQATKDWILSLDSDEWIPSSSYQVIRGIIHDASCIYSPLQPSVSNTTSFIVPRLFPRRPDARWVYALHEQIWFDGWTPMQIPMSHFAVLTDSGGAERGPKTERNLAIIEKMKQGSAEEQQLAQAYETFERYRLDPDSDDTQRLLEVTTASLKETPSGLRRRSFMLLASIYGQKQQWDNLENLATQADDAGFGGLWSKHALARIALMRGEHAKALRYAEEGLVSGDVEGPVAKLRAELNEIIKMTRDL